ncbi:MAG: hypothetical protein OEW19_08950 [Acidobacteriota bacterium]|nr:hypothetical protein [Acidobacteriota bacterium]
MPFRPIVVLVLVSLALAGTPVATEQPAEAPVASAVEQLRHAVGRWAVTTEFLRPDGTVGRTVSGTYEFEWIVPDRVVRGRSDIPELKQSAGILFYVNPTGKTIEMVSVGADGQLFTMKGPLDGETRYSQTFKTADGKDSQLRFTRSHVSPDRFESRMEHTEDGGQTWAPGNHQVFTRTK